MAAETTTAPRGGVIRDEDREALLLRKGVVQASALRRMFNCDDEELMRALVAGGLALIARRRGVSGDAAGQVLFARLRPAIEQGCEPVGALAAELPAWI